jgi:hypothetical protein
MLPVFLVLNWSRRKFSWLSSALGVLHKLAYAWAEGCLFIWRGAKFFFSSHQRTNLQGCYNVRNGRAAWVERRVSSDCASQPWRGEDLRNKKFEGKLTGDPDDICWAGVETRHLRVLEASRCYRCTWYASRSMLPIESRLIFSSNTVGSAILIRSSV